MLVSPYAGVSVKADFRCAQGHLFSVRPHSVLYDGTWCPQCWETRRKAGTTTVSLEEVTKRLASKGYKLLGSYKHSERLTTLLHLECGREIEATVRNALRGRPCRFCSGLTRDNAIAYALAKNGELVSWAGTSSTKTLWRCGAGHTWYQSWTAVKNGYWCGSCKKSFQPSSNPKDLAARSRRQLDTYKRYDIRMGFATDLTAEDICVFRSTNCSYCKTRQATGADRIDNQKGHLKANCVAACVRCNWVRGSYLSHLVMLQVGELLGRIDP